MASIERIPWHPRDRRYRITAIVQGGQLEMNAMTRWGARRQARRLDRMRREYQRWETGGTP